MQKQHYFSVHLTTFHLSITQSPPNPLGRIQPNLLHHLPSWLGCVRATLFFCPSVRHPSICPSGYLPYHWAEFNQTCYMTSPDDKGVEEQVSPSIMLLATLAKSVGICDGAPWTAHSSIFLISPWKYMLLKMYVNCFARVIPMSNHNMFLWRNKKKLSIYISHQELVNCDI